MGRSRQSPDRLTPEQERELLSGPDLALALAGERDRASLFPSAAARLESWRVHKRRLCADQAEREPGSRPWMFWQVHKRPDLGGDAFERLRFLIGKDLVLDAEAAELIREGREARVRVGTDEERFSEIPSDDEHDRLEARLGTLLEDARR